MGKTNGTNNGPGNCADIDGHSSEYICQTESAVYEFPLCTDSGILVNSDGYKETSLYSAVFDKHCCFTEKYLMTVKDGRKSYDFMCFGPHPEDSAYKPVVVDANIKIRDCVFIAAIDRTSQTSVRFHDIGKDEEIALFRHLNINIIRSTRKYPAWAPGYVDRSICIKGVELTELESTVTSGESFCSVESD